MRLLTSICLIAFIAGISVAAYYFALQRYKGTTLSTSKERLQLYEASLRSTLERVAHLPRVAILHPDTNNILKNGVSNSDYNSFLKQVNEQAGSAALYLLNSHGDTIASSNYDLKESFIGKNYQFRKYFLDALQSGQGRFFAVGATTGRPGYFFSELARHNDQKSGVAVVKVEFAKLLADWQSAGEKVLITNEDGIIILASNPDWLYHSIAPITESRLKAIRSSRQFANYDLKLFEFESESSKFEASVEVSGDTLLVNSFNLHKLGWSIHLLAPIQSARASAFAIGALSFLLCVLVLFGFLYGRARTERARLALVANQAEQIQHANNQLELEVAERKQTEEQLRDMQTELIQSSRLAALGKMSAAIVHEVNQPVSAIRTFASSGSLLLKKNRTEETREIFEQINSMTERLGAITSDLLVFSRKPVSQPSEIDIHSCIQNITLEKEVQFAPARIVFDINLAKENITVSGSKHRYEQLIGNLLQNAAQACLDKQAPKVEITTKVLKSAVQISIKDNGTGIAPHIEDQLFDPFFTTKGIGEGMGLGLALAYAIVDEVGGKIRGRNHKDGGAEFIVELPFSGDAGIEK